MLDTKLLRPSRRYALLALARNGGLYTAALIGVSLAGHVGGWILALAAPMLGLAMYRLTIVIHDCIHGTLFRSPRTNRLIGTIAGAFAGIEFAAFARLHQQHHRIVGQPADPQGPDYLVSETASRLMVLWHLFRPLTGYNLFKLGQVLASGLRGAGERSGRWTGFGLVATVQVLMAGVASSGFQNWWLALAPALSAATFGLFFAQARGFAEHAAMPGVDPAGFVRSHEPRLIDRIFLYDLNFNFHREHHCYPAIPSCRLPELHRQLAIQDPGGFALTSGMFATIRRRVTAGQPSRAMPASVLP